VRWIIDLLATKNIGEAVDLHYFGVGHTNGDTFVVFPLNGGRSSPMPKRSAEWSRR
jgi:hypothetical protein